MQDAVDLLHPLLTDTVDYVKQGALIATALVLMQQPESKVHCLHSYSANSFGSALKKPNCVRSLHPSIKQHLQLQAWNIFNCSTEVLQQSRTDQAASSHWDVSRRHGSMCATVVESWPETLCAKCH